MGTLLLVRHGQASFAAEDYDRLSATGAEQCRRLGAHWRAAGVRPDAVLTGTLRRHAQSWAAIAEGLGDGPQPQRLAGLDEYDSHALLATLAEPAQRLDEVATRDGRREYFRRLREALERWIDGASSPAGMPSHVDFRAGVRAALDQARALDGDGRRTVVVVSSGGPISCAVAELLRAPPRSAVGINMRLRNSAVSECALTRTGIELASFNELPHLADAADAALRTHA